MCHIRGIFAHKDSYMIFDHSPKKKLAYIWIIQTEPELKLSYPVFCARGKVSSFLSSHESLHYWHMTKKSVQVFRACILLQQQLSIVHWVGGHIPFNVEIFCFDLFSQPLEIWKCPFSWRDCLLINILLMLIILWQLHCQDSLSMSGEGLVDWFYHIVFCCGGTLKLEFSWRFPFYSIWIFLILQFLGFPKPWL